MNMLLCVLCVCNVRCKTLKIIAIYQNVFGYIETTQVSYR